jgi:peptidoglycan/xylan/chitin deacetylase (PgdA/CDA1 family)
MITHDVDATTAFDTMSYYSDYENSIGLSATYLITTHYLNDGALSDFYNPSSIPQVQTILTKGHKLASHSVGHFTDFDIDSIVPVGILGNTTTSYLPYNGGAGYSTVGATVLGETEVSKNVLQNDLGVNIRTFRAGYLCYNKKLVNALDSVGYEYNSTYSSGDVLTNFPYRNHKDRNSAGTLTNVWELPMTISDVFSADPISATNYPAKQAIWLDVINRNRANYAPNVLLIHPNRIYKLWAQQDLIDQLPSDMFTTDLETFADYWRGRDSIEFTSMLSNDTLTITIPSYQLPLNNMISFIVDDGQSLSFIKAQDEFGNLISVIQSNWDDNGLILHFGYYSPLSIAWKENPEQTGLLANCFPNPFSSSSTLEIWFKEDAQLNICLYNLMGQLISESDTEALKAGIYRHTINANDLPAGTYYCKISTGQKSIVKKLILLQQ